MWTFHAERRRTPEMRRYFAQRIAEGDIPSVSKLEDQVAAWLDAKGIPYERQKRVNYYSIDFVVSGVFVEINGCYWHGCPCLHRPRTQRQMKKQRRDAALAGYCEKRSLPLVVIWEHDIRANDWSKLETIIR